jgi:hypothetical protein
MLKLIVKFLLSLGAKDILSWHWWLMSVIQAMREAEIRGSWFQVSSGKKLMKPHLDRKKMGMVVCICHPSYGWKHKIVPS